MWPAGASSAGARLGACPRSTREFLRNDRRGVRCFGRVKEHSSYVSSLIDLAGAAAADRRVLFRQAMAALSRASSEGPGPLEGFHPEVLSRSVSAALSAGLVDDLDWLSPAAAGVALYTLAAALPLGVEQRELGRRVLARLLAGDAETFTTIATAIARSGGRGLGSPNVRARVALVTELPLAHGVADGPLALALVSRREYQRDWIVGPSTRSLPARRLAAKILERAAREAARRAQMGDGHAFRAFASEGVRGAFERLLADRESLVWRYVAVARGLAAGWDPAVERQLGEDLREGLSPTEWRRAATSLAAFAAVRPDEALKMTGAVVKRGLFTREDPPSAAAFVWGIARTIEAEPEVATKLLDVVLPGASPEVAEAVVELRYEYGASGAVERAFRQASELLARGGPSDGDDGADALRLEIARDLELRPRPDQPVRALVREALDAYVTGGAAAAYELAREVLAASKAGMTALEAVATDDDAEGRTGKLARRTSMAVMRDLDTSLLERPVIASLLRLGSATEARLGEEALDAIRERFAEWIARCEGPEQLAAANAPRHATLRLRRLRALLHLLDGDLGEAHDPASRLQRASAEEGADGDRERRLRALWLRTVNALLDHFRQDPAPLLKRTLLAAVARALDALVRLGVCDVADALLVLAARLRASRDFDALAEASMDPDLRRALASYAAFLRATEPTLAIAASDSARPSDAREERALRLGALEALADALTAETSARTDALRTVLVRVHASLAAVANVGALSALSSSGTTEADLVGAVETWVGALAQMSAGASGRLDPGQPPLSTAPPHTKSLGIIVSRVLAEADGALDPGALGDAIDALVRGVPHGFGRLVSGILWGLGDLPVERPSAEAGVLAITEPLPAWLSARRTIGGFYVQRALGSGGAASVFVVTRAEDRHDPSAERFALKVPDYDVTAARSLSRDEFLTLFREEASALILLPSHANLARFVTFDMGTKPLPILVMELVEGVTLERVLEARTLDMERCLKALDDVLAGLEAMHGAGLGHLDVKPANVLLRRGEQGVLVDFGLSGRKIRQGCGTGSYGAPEVWGVLPEGFVASPAAADIYAFGCLAFEVLTTRVLFDAPSEVAQITMHLSHDGLPPPIKALLAHPEVAALAEALAPTLRRDPGERPSAAQLRAALRALWPSVESAGWPVEIDGVA